MTTAKSLTGSHSGETTQALDECLRAAEAHIDALSDLWDGLLHAAPFPGMQEEMRRTIERYEIVFTALHAIQMRAFDYKSHSIDARIFDLGV